jgi:purine-cytosine permease-like protein
MKRPLVFRLVKIWCGLYTFVLLASVSKLLKSGAEVHGLSLCIDLLPFLLMLVGFLGIHNEQRWATWLCAVLLGLLTIHLLVGYQRMVSAGGHPLPLLVLFSTVAAVNIVSSGYLARSPYCRSFQKPNENPGTPS